MVAQLQSMFLPLFAIAAAVTALDAHRGKQPSAVKTIDINSNVMLTALAHQMKAQEDSTDKIFGNVLASFKQIDAKDTTRISDLPEHPAFMDADKDPIWAKIQSAIDTDDYKEKPVTVNYQKKQLTSLRNGTPKK